MPALDNSKHEAFLARWLDHTKPIADCYLETVAEPDKPLKRSAALKAAVELLDRPEIIERLAELRLVALTVPKTEAEASLVLTVEEKRQWLARTVRLDFTKIDMEKDGDLIQTIKQTQFGDQIVVHDKIAAIKLDNDMTGGGGGYEEIQLIMRRMIRPGSPIDRAKGTTVVPEAEKW
jgi:hypothetical protein